MPSRLLTCLITLCLFCSTPVYAADLPALTEFKFRSTLDDSEQPALVLMPEQAKTESTPLLVFLHSWSGNYLQNNSKWQREAVERNWGYLHPNFRGRNDHPEACGSELARQDILDSIQHVLENANIDRSRIYLAGTSGGGHMAMLMAGYHPAKFSAVTAWVGISDLAEWHRFHARTTPIGNYARMIERSLGGPPGQSKEIDARYRSRSPIFHLDNTGDLPLDLNAGIHDGHTGSVPIAHTLNAFNRIARAQGTREVTAAEIEQLSNEQPLTTPQPSDEVPKSEYNVDIHLRRHAGPARVTIFEGGHEGLPQPAVKWLEQQRRKTSWP